MKIKIVAIGKKHDPKIAGSIEDYTKRLGHYIECEWVLYEAKITPSMPEPQIKEAESRQLLAYIDQQDIVILLDERGIALDSMQLADKLQQLKNQGRKQLVFVIGGAFGVTSQLQSRADFIWSLSPLVFPHQLVRLILAEQLYRAHTILAGEKYHHQ